jgi:hypothetical protein
MKKSTCSSIASAVVGLLFGTVALTGIIACAGQAVGGANNAVALREGYVMDEKMEATKSAEMDGGAVTGEVDKKTAEDASGAASPEASLEAARRLTLREDLRVRAPELLARIDKPDTEPLPFAAHDISVVIAGHRARVVYDMVFSNPSGKTLSGTLMVELPQGASPCYLGLFQGEGAKGRPDAPAAALLPPQPASPAHLLLKELALENSWRAEGLDLDWGEARAARVVNPVRGREVYEQVTRRRVDPALAEWAGGNTFSTRVYPIAPRSFKRVVFAYERPLALSGGALTYALPLPSTIKARTRLFVHLLDSDLTGGRLLRDGRELAAEKTSAGSFWKVEPEKNFTGTVVFSGVLKRRDLSVLSGGDVEVPGRLIHLLYAPDVKKAAAPRSTGRAVFLLDTSLSGRDRLFSRSGALLKSILESDESLKEFAVVAFDVRPRPFTRGFTANTRANRDALFASLEGLWLEGATNFSGALQFLAADKTLAAADAYFLLSDGLITWGSSSPIELQNGFPDLFARRWICYTFGDEAANRPLFAALTRSGGQIVASGPEQDLEQAAAAHRFAPFTLDSVYGTRQEEVLVAGDPRLVYPGQVLEIAVRARGDQASATLAVTIDGVKKTVEVNAAERSAAAPLAARAWAEVYADRLLDLQDVKANEAVLALSQHFALSNREASFIVLETDKEYDERKIDAVALDWRELARLAREKRARFPFGAPDTAGLDEATLAFLDALQGAPAVKLWDAPPPAALSGNPALILAPPALPRPTAETPVALYAWAQELKQGAGPNDPAASDQALRALSSIVELKPQDDAGLRLVGYTLLEWALYREAEELFRLVRQRRPFEPQNYLLEGLALAVQGKTRDAALRFEIVLAGDYPRFNDFAKPVAAALYSQLLEAVAASGRAAGAQAARRLEKLGRVPLPRGRLFLFWNLDDTDVDLHVQEPNGDEVFYSSPRSRTGGKLYWDNTAGLGPEWYEHPALDPAGFDVFVDYFGTRSVEGVAPSATLVCAFTQRRAGSAPELRFYTTVLAHPEEDKVLIMPKWKR